MTSDSTVSPRYSGGYSAAKSSIARRFDARRPEVVSDSRVGHPRHVGRVVLTVGVDLDGEVVPLPLGEPVPGPHRATDAEVERQVEDHRAVAARHPGRAI